LRLVDLVRIELTSLQLAPLEKLWTHWELNPELGNLPR